MFRKVCDIFRQDGPTFAPGYVLRSETLLQFSVVESLFCETHAETHGDGPFVFYEHKGNTWGRSSCVSRTQKDRPRVFPCVFRVTDSRRIIIMIFAYFVLLIIGFAALIKGADLFVDGSSSLARIFYISGVIIGLTIVALGTSAPELAVSTVAAVTGSNEIALSNVVGSNLFNLLSVLGVCALIHPLPVATDLNKRDFPISIIVTVLVLIATCSKTIVSRAVLIAGMEDIVGNVSRAVGIMLLILFVCYIAYLIYDAKKHPEEEENTEEASIKKCVLFIIVGIILIVAGGQAVVNSAKEIARTFGMSETLIGFTIVAIGTSLPELVTSIVAARKGETGMAVGNVVGSNIFNLLFILGVSSTIHPITVNMASLTDMAILIVVSVLAYVFGLTKKQISRPEGIVMLLIYAADVVYAIVR